VSGRKATRGLGYIVTFSCVVSVHPFVVVAIRSILYTIAVLVLFTGNVISVVRLFGFWGVIVGVTLQLYNVAYYVLFTVVYVTSPHPVSVILKFASGLVYSST